MGAKVLVTGGAGFIGSHLVEKLAAEGKQVRILDNLSNGKLSNIRPLLQSDGDVDFVKGDIRDHDLVEKCVSNVDAVIHLAAQISVPLSIKNPEFTHDVNVNGTKNVLSISEKASVDKFVFISSCAVYGEPVYLPIDEKHPTKPISPYAESKLDSERECLRLNLEHRLESVVLRFFNVYGLNQGLNDYSGVIAKFKDRIKQRLPLIVYGDGSQTRDFVYVQDVVNAIMLALENQAVNGEIFNIGTGKATSIKELSQTMLSLTRVDLNVLNAPARSGEILHSYADVSKANKLLKYKPQFTLKDGLKKLLSC